ncbi:hypothetical protein ABT403_26290 [Streptomyces sp. NPDC000075]|uniref:hypothetical protein n=1 Tax=Streptomyces sp. NPDC000075 TaxID=3154241 RepID=UPI00332FF63F
MPAAPVRWAGVGQALEFGPGVPQSGPLPSGPHPRARGPIGSHGCPHPRSGPGRAGLPVLVWIDGGGYI